jgi:hypothetical protein
MKIIEDKDIVPTDCYIPIDIEDLKRRVDNGYFKFEPQKDGNGDLISIDLIRTDRYEKIII